jgi:hypothetical protein
MEESTIELGTMVLERHRSTYQVRLEGMRPHELPSAAATSRFIAQIGRRWLLADAQAESIPLLLQINGGPGGNRNRVVVEAHPVGGAPQDGAAAQTSFAAPSSGGQSAVATAREPIVDGAHGTSAPARTETQQTSPAPTVATNSASHSAPTGAGEVPRSERAVVAEQHQPKTQVPVPMVDPPLHSQAAAAPSPVGDTGARAEPDVDQRTIISASLLGGEARQPAPAAGARTEHAVVVPEQGHPRSTPATHPPSSDSLKMAPVGSLMNDAPAPPAEVASQSGAQIALAHTPASAQQSPPIEVVLSINLPPAHVAEMRHRETSASTPSSQASTPSQPPAAASSTAAAGHGQSASASTPHSETAHPAPTHASAKPDEHPDSMTSVRAQDLFTSLPSDPMLLAPAAATPHSSPAQTHPVTSAASVAVHHDLGAQTATPASANASSAIDLDELKAEILRTLARDIALEAERRGVVSWDF